MNVDGGQVEYPDSLFHRRGHLEIIGDKHNFIPLTLWLRYEHHQRQIDVLRRCFLTNRGGKPSHLVSSTEIVVIIDENSSRTFSFWTISEIGRTNFIVHTGRDIQ